MACFHPLDAWQLESGDIVFAERGRIRRSLQLPCGQCIGCKLERSRQWAMRCLHESQLHPHSSFVTLTYDDAHVSTSLDYRDFQLFMKRARRKLGPFRFYMCGEYGERTLRPHFHALFFGLHFADRYHWRSSSSGFDLFRSTALEALWTHGYAEIGDVTFESAGYVARYCMKKVTGPGAEDHYKRVDIRTGEIVDCVPEFTRMSLKPGIGLDWLRLYRSDVYRGDGNAYVVVNGMKCKPPRYYDEYVSGSSAFNDVEYVREMDALSRRHDSTPERLAVRESVARARLSFKQRDKI